MIELEKPYVWWNAESYPQRGRLIYNTAINKTDKYIFMDAKPVPTEEDYGLILECGIPEEKMKKFDLLPNNSTCPIVSKRTVDLLKEICPDDFQAFPVKIVSGSKMEPYENNDYYLINIMREIDSVNRDESYLRIREDGLRIRDIKKLFFKPGCMGNTHLAREKYFHPMIILSPTLVAAFKKHKIKGGSFQTDQESYNDSFPDEYLEKMYPIDLEAAKRFFVSQMNSQEEYEFFKTRVHKVPREITLALIDMTLSRSSFHKEQCEELLRILNEKRSHLKLV